MFQLRTESHGCTIIAIVYRLNSILVLDRVEVLDLGRNVECENLIVLLEDEGSAFAKLHQHGGW